MSLTIAQMIALVRQDLHDEDAANYRWTDGELTRHINRAVKEFSDSIPYEKQVELATISASRDIDISSIMPVIMIEAVEYPLAQFPRIYQRFSYWGNVLTVLGPEVPDGSNAKVYYGVLHILTAIGYECTIPSHNYDLVATGAAAYAALQWAVYTLNRVNVGGGKTPQEFLLWSNERLKYFKAELNRLGRKNRVRVRSLYKSYYPSVSKTTDYGP